MTRPRRSDPRLPRLARARRRTPPGWMLALALVAAGITAVPRARSAPVGGESERPKLLVVLVIDQMRADYADRYGQQWTHGLERLFDTGADFRDAAYPYLNTVTCAGHATIATGAFPRTHGLVLNEWWDRTVGQEVTCTADPDASLVSYGPPAKGGESAWRLEVPTLADELRAQLAPTPRIVTLSLKARTAIMLAGHRGDAVTWFDGSGTWVTSTAYATAPVPFVERFVAANPVAGDFGKVWTRALDARAYRFDDAGLGERAPKGWGPTFPHPLAGDGTGTDADRYERWRQSPFSDAYLGRLAEAAVDELKLGRGPGLDYLGVSFSALDLVGHRFGPRSHEVQDILVGLDGTIGRLLDHLDRVVGPGRYAVALTSDHGVGPIPEQMSALGLSAGRVDEKGVAARIEESLQPWLGRGPHVAAVDHTDIYFAPGVYAQLKTTPEAMRAVISAIEATPGIWTVFQGEDLRDANLSPSADPALRAAALSYRPGRSGDLIAVPRPYWAISTEATTHGSAYLYDERVPLVFMGAGIRPGRYLERVTPADLAPTLACLAGVTLAMPEGRVLAEALAPPANPAPKTPPRR